MRAIRSSIMRRSVSIWVSPGPPRKPKPPRWRSRCVQERTNLLFWYVRWASSTCSAPSRVRARRPKISRIRPVRSSTLAPQAFSRLRCCTGESAQSITTIPAVSPLTRPAISSTLPLPMKLAGRMSPSGTMPEDTTLRSIARASPTASSSRASGARGATWARSAAEPPCPTCARSCARRASPPGDRARRCGSITMARPVSAPGRGIGRSLLASNRRGSNYMSRHGDVEGKSLPAAERSRVLHLFPDRCFLRPFEQLDRMTRHDRRDGVLVDQLRVSVTPQQHAEIIEPSHDPLQLHAVHQEDRERRLVLADVVEKGVLQIL